MTAPEKYQLTHNGTRFTLELRNVGVEDAGNYLITVRLLCYDFRRRSSFEQNLLIGCI